MYLETHQLLDLVRILTVYRKDTDSTMSKFEARLQKTEEDIKETKTNVKQILDILTRNNS
jgi:hypothetical protein